jgi:hypothetical protein
MSEDSRINTISNFMEGGDTMSATTKLKRRTVDSDQLSPVLDKLNKAMSMLEKYLEMRIQTKRGTTESLADQEVQHTVPARKIMDMRVYLERQDRESKLGKEWARKFNPHYKNQ